MELRSRFKTLSYRRVVRLVTIVSVISLSAITFQNCSPVGDATGGANVTASSTSSCSLKPAPILTGSIPNQTMRAGLNDLAGNAFPATLSVNLQMAYPGQNAQLNCKSSVGAIDINCNSARDIRINTKEECFAGTATITIEAEDIICRKKSAQITFQVTSVNACTAQTKIHHDAPVTNDQFGSDVAIDRVTGTTAVAAAVGDDERGMGAGAAFVLKQSGSSWLVVQKLTPASLAANDTIQSVAISGNLIVLGSPYHDKSGAAFVYRFNGTSWVEAQVLKPSQANTTFDSDLFGQDVAISGSTIVVGAPGNNHADLLNFKEAGAVFVFHDSGATVTEDHMLTATDAQKQDYFGWSVAVAGSRVAVGAPSSLTADQTAFAGKTYVYDLVAVTESAITPGCPCVTGMGSRFGYAVALDVIDQATGKYRLAASGVAGAGVGAGTGVVVLYTSDGSVWTKEGKVQSTDGKGADSFGSSLALRGSRLLVGSPGSTVKTGAAYLYTLNGTAWAQTWKFEGRKADRSEQDLFGESVDFGGSSMIAGSRVDDDTGLNTGTVYVIGLP